MITDTFTLLFVFIVIGFFTFIFRATFLFYKPRLFQNEMFKDGLDSVPNSLLIAFVVPFTFFVSGVFLPFRIQVLAVITTIPIVYYLKKPGLSLPIAIVIYGILAVILSFLSF